MAKVTIKNYAEHEFHLPARAASEDGKTPYAPTIKFPRLGTRVGPDGVPTEVPGSIDVDEAVVERMKGHPVTRSWLEPDARGRRQLVVEAAKAEAPPKK
jgi:hypothetical protein